MPWCPICKTEYREGFKVCSDCGNNLVEELESLSEAEKYPYSENKWVLLISCVDDQEADIIESFLLGENIPLYRKYRGAGEYLKITWGTTRLGIDLYVLESQFETAKEIVDGVFREEEKSEGQKLEKQKLKQDFRSFEAEENNIGRKRYFLVAIVSLVSIIIGILASTWETFKQIFN